jgi:hypothetical protein
MGHDARQDRLLDIGEFHVDLFKLVLEPMPLVRSLRSVTFEMLVGRPR